MNTDQIQARAQEYLKKMTPQQKLAQTMGMFDGEVVPPDILERFPDGLGGIAFMPGTNTKEKNYELCEKETETLKKNGAIPALRHNEALTGQMTADSTVFPSAIGLGATWNPETVRKMADLIRRQMVSEGTRQALSPVMDVARDPRWGRMGETYGEDPTLCAAMSVAFTKGLQSDNLEEGVIATGKHFLGYALSEGGLNMAANPIPARELREVYAKPFQAAITEAGLAAVMNSYGSIDGELIIASYAVLTKLLREEMGFEGLVVSDYMSIDKMVDLQISATPQEAGLEALKAGLDLELPKPYGYTDKMLALLDNDVEGRKALDRAVEKVLEAKLKLGLIDGCTGKKEWMEESYNRQLTEPVSLEAARKSIVLLKNDGILPLKAETKKIGLIGPHVDSIRLLFGGYTYPAAYERDVTDSMSDMPGMEGVGHGKKDNPYRMPYLSGSRIRGTSDFIERSLREHYRGKTKTILEAVREQYPNAEIRAAKGCNVAGTDESGFAEALKVADWADVVIVVGGGKYGWGSSCTTGEGIDCDNIGLPGIQEKLAILIAERKKQTVFVHMDVKPLSSESIVDHYNAVLENWFPGDTGGKALAEVLSGIYNPAGRLPVTAARNAGQIPIYASQRKGSGYHPGKGMTIAKYAEGEKTPLFYFGEGLSYTTFSYDHLQITEDADPAGTVTVSCDITNTGSVDGEEVVQFYITDLLSQMLRPEQELAGFYRVFLKAGESKRIFFESRTDQFAFLDNQMKWLVEEGKMLVKIGSSSEDIRLKGEFNITKSAYIDGKKRGFYAKTREERIVK